MDVRDVFDDWARRGRAEGMEKGHRTTAGPALERLGPRVGPGTRFLDLGCGNGWATRWAAERGAEAVGVDASPEMVRRATRLADGAARFEEADFVHLPFADDSFDVVWSMEALYYAPDPDAVLAEVARVLAPGGMVALLMDFYMENAASHGWPEDVGVPMVLRSEAAWRASLEAAGLQKARSLRLRAPEAEEAWKQKEGTLLLTASAPDANSK